MAKQCPSLHSCLKYGKRHHTLLHVDDSKPPENKPELSKQGALNNNLPPFPTPSPPSNPPTSSESTASLSFVATPKANSLNNVLMMTAEVIVSSPSGQQMTARSLLDPASTASFITERLAQHLKLRRSKQEITINGIGGSQCSTLSNSIVNINLNSTQSSSTLSNVQATVLQSLTRCLPTTSFPKGHWPHLSSLKLADPAFNISKPIDILLGVSAYHDILKQGFILGPKGTPSAQETLFGWVLFIRSTTESVTTLHVSTAYTSCEETLQKFWTLEEPPKPKVPVSLTDKLALQHYNQHLKHEENGRFIVKTT